MISILTSFIAGLGFILLTMLFLQVNTLHQIFRLKKHRAKDTGFSDLLNYAAVVDDGVIVGKNGSFMAAWIYQGEDNASTTDQQRNMIAFRINQALGNLGSGWMVHIDAVRKTAPGYIDKSQSHFKDALSKAIDKERRALFENIGNLYEGYFVITFTWFPPMLAERRFVELMFDDDSKTHDKTVRTTNLIKSFQRECGNIESRLSSALSLERLKSEKIVTEHGEIVVHDHFLRWLQYCVTGINQPIILPENPIYLDALIGGQELWTGVIPKLGRRYIQCVAIEGFPLEATPGVLSLLTQLPIEYRWSNRMIFMDHYEAINHLEKYRKKWKQKVRGFFDQVFNTNSSNVDQDALSMVADASDAIAETNSGMVSQGYYTSVVVLMDENREAVEAAALQIEKAINSLGFAARTETINTMDAFMGSLPGHGVENIRRPLLNSMNLAYLMPTHTIWTGENEAPSPLFPVLSPPLMHCVTNGNSPFRLNLHVRDLGHTIMFGPTRSGKSTHLAMLALQWRRYQGSRIYAFDKGLSMYATCKAVGGDHYTIAGKDETLAFAPLQFLDSREDRAWAMEWIDNILALNGLITTPQQRNEIANAIVNMHKSGSKTLSEFTMLIQDETIREALKQYTIDGLMGHLLDAEQDGLGVSDFMTFEIEKLMGLGEKFALPVLLYLFRRIETSLDGRPTLIILDEAWLMLAHPVFCKKIAEWLDAMAKKNCSVILATQHISHAVNSGILDVIVESTATKLFLPNMHAHQAESQALYHRMGLNEAQINVIATAIPKREYYYFSEKGSRLYSLALGPLALAFAGAGDPDSITAIQELEQQHGREWVREWMKIKQLTHYDYGVAA